MKLSKIDTKFKELCNFVRNSDLKLAPKIESAMLRNVAKLERVVLVRNNPDSLLVLPGVCDALYSIYNIIIGIAVDQDEVDYVDILNTIYNITQIENTLKLEIIFSVEGDDEVSFMQDMREFCAEFYDKRIVLEIYKAKKRLESK